MLFLFELYNMLAYFLFHVKLIILIMQSCQQMKCVKQGVHEKRR